MNARTMQVTSVMYFVLAYPLDITMQASDSK